MILKLNYLSGETVEYNPNAKIFFTVKSNPNNTDFILHSDKFMERAQMVGMFLLFGLLIWANFNDILRYFF